MISYGRKLKKACVNSHLITKFVPKFHENINHIANDSNKSCRYYKVCISSHLPIIFCMMQFLGKITISD